MGLHVAEKLSSIVRSVSVAEERETPRDRDHERDQEPDRDKETINTYDQYGARARSHQGSRTSSLTRESRAESRNDIRESNPRTENGHWRNHSITTASDYVEAQTLHPGRRQEYDAQSMEGDLARPSSVSHPIPPPVVTVKSEFPTINRSKVQQSLTCLVAVEVPERKSNNFADDVPAVPSTPQQYDRQYQSSSPTANSQHSLEGQDTQSTKRERDLDRERQQELLTHITEDLRLRVENWHGLDFNRYLP